MTHTYQQLELQLHNHKLLFCMQLILQLKFDDPLLDHQFTKYIMMFY